MANEIQLIEFSAVPTAGSWRPVFNGSSSGTAMDYSHEFGDLDGILAQCVGIDFASNVTVTGSYTAGFTVEFVGDLANTNVSTLSYQDNTLKIAGSGSVSTHQEGGGGTDEQQDVTIVGDGGTFTLTTYIGTTSAITRDVSDTTTATNIANALNSLGHGAVSVSVVSAGVLRVTFSAVDAGTDVAQMTIDASLVTQSVTISVSVVQEGSPVGVFASISASTASIAENGGMVSVIATLDSTASDTVTIVLDFTGDAATGSDYTVSTNTITIASGDTSGSISATAINDSIYEGNENFTASITSVTGGGASASSTASTSTVTIVDDEVQPTLTPGVAACTTSVIAPSVVASVSVSPGVAVCSTSAIEPSVPNGTTLTPDAIVCASSAIAPSVVLGQVSLSVDAVTVSTSALTPTVSCGAVSVSVDVALCATTTVAPAVTTGGISTSPDVCQCTSSVTAPTVILGGVSVSAGVAEAAASVLTPTISCGSVSVSVDTATASCTATSPSVLVSGPVSLSVDACVVTCIAVSPDVSTVVRLTPSPYRPRVSRDADVYRRSVVDQNEYRRVRSEAT